MKKFLLLSVLFLTALAPSAFAEAVDVRVSYNRDYYYTPDELTIFPTYESARKDLFSFNQSDYAIIRTTGSDDHANHIFVAGTEAAAIEEALDYYWSGKAADVITSINSNIPGGGSYTLGNRVNVYADVGGELALKQDHSANLEFWSEVAPNPHVEELMSHANKGDLWDYMEAGTAAFEDVEYFAAASHSHVADDITDATAVGKGVLKAADAAAAKTAMWFRPFGNRCV
jgi:opacity protein-like surface antigen